MYSTHKTDRAEIIRRFHGDKIPLIILYSTSQETTYIHHHNQKQLQKTSGQTDVVQRVSC